MIDYKTCDKLLDLLDKGDLKKLRKYISDERNKHYLLAARKALTEYLNTLSAGTHQVTFNFNDGKYLSTTLVINEKGSGDNPGTGDNILLYVSILGLSLLGLIGLGIFKKKFD